jgi:phosphate transport system protein
MLITRQQPLASDLRLVSSALKVVTDLEREGDQVSDMAELLLRIHMKDLSTFSVHLPQMIIDTKTMLHESVDAFINRDVETAKRVIMTDDIIDMFFNKVKEDLIKHIRNNSKDTDECIDVLMLAKYLEKMGDHAVNIGDWTIFRESGVMRDTRLM